MNIIIASSNDIFRKGIRHTISTSFSKFHMEEARNSASLEALTSKYAPALVIIDLESERIEPTKMAEHIKKYDHHVKILVFTGETRKNAVLPLLKLGVEGYLLKEASCQEIISAVRNLTEGKNYYDQSIGTVMHERIMGPDMSHAHVNKITQRETEILNLLCQQYTNREIGELLNISRRTVDSHRNRIMKKLGVKNTAGLIRFAIENGLTSTSEN